MCGIKLKEIFFILKEKFYELFLASRNCWLGDKKLKSFQSLFFFIKELVFSVNHRTVRFIDFIGLKFFF